MHLGVNKIKVIDPKAFQYLTKLKWLNLKLNSIQSLSYQLFDNNPDLIYVNLKHTEISSIHPNFFNGLLKLKLLDFAGNFCTLSTIGCATCRVTKSDLDNKLQSCYNRCSNGTNCLATYLAHQTAPIDKKVIIITETPPSTTTEKTDDPKNFCKNLELISQETQATVKGLDDKLANLTKDLQSAVETGYELSRNISKEAIESNNQNGKDCCASSQKILEKLQESVAEIANLKNDMMAMEGRLEKKMASIVQEKLDALEKRLTSGG